jgi:putative peptidoglycan lipid II flippase
VRRVARLLGPRIVTIGAFQLIFVFQDNLASRLDVGSVTGLAYGWLIMQVPETMIGTAVGIALLPTLAMQFARGDNQGFEVSVARAVRVLLALTLPAAVLMAVALPPLVQAAFNFSAQGTNLVVQAGRAFLVGLVGHSLLEIAARAFYARQDAKTPLAATAVNAVVFVSLSLLLFRSLGSAGIALSNSLAFTLEAVLLLAVLSRTFPGILRQGRTFLRLVLGAGAAGAAALGAGALLPAAGLIGALASMGIGGLVLIPFILPELRELRAL